MQTKISRRKLAIYVVDQFDHGTRFEKAIEQLAAYLIESRRLREIDLVVRAIEDELAARGTVVARVTTARPLNETLRKSIEKMIAAKQVYVKEIVDPTILGGVCIETPSHTLDATMKRKLLALRQAKI